MKHTKSTALISYCARWWLVLLCAAMPLHTSAKTAASAEYKLKAALLYKLTRFIEWPADSQQQQFGICVLGRDDFGRSLNALKGKSVRGSKVSVHRIKLSENIRQQCQIVFLSDSKRAFQKSILKSLAHRPILTISDNSDFTEEGGMIQFTRGAKRIGFKINLQKAKSSKLDIAAPLLELATIVGNGQHGHGK